MQAGFVDQQAVGQLTVLAELLAVVPHHRHDRPVGEPLAVQLCKQAAHLGIHLGDLAVVRPVRVEGAERLRGGVRRVRVVEVHPGEERLFALLGEPGDRAVGHHPARPLRIQVGHALAGDVVVVPVEASHEPKPTVQHERPDEGSRAVPRRGELRCERRGVLREALGAVVPDAVVGREQAREDRRMGGQRERHGGAGIREPHALRGETVQIRGLDLAVAVGADVVRSHRVEGDQQDVASGARGGGPGPGATGRDESHGGQRRAENPQESRPP